MDISFKLPEELQSDINFIKTELAEIKKNFQPKDPKRYLSRKEVSQLLGVDISTVNNWKNKGLIKPKQIGGRILYERKHIEEALIDLKK